ncbi:glycosyltransferase [Rhodococcus sp. Eu-32]|uniref:glycosyltransferase n=1 Tax=Rhodococcus sp. Eu-32 TaxID=1017319 RepID=UPI000DF13F90|nr:glycosyltransferase [Rhodococcus sp. Eu-32]RRQ29222.1 glycosyltransferase [Rhodococcus sp. Eu-32]
MKKPSVAIIGTRGYPSYYGGFETLIRRLAPYLADAGWDVIVYGRPGTVATDDTVDTRVRSVITRGFETKSLSTLSFGLSAILHSVKRKPDVTLIMNVANGYWLPILKVRKVPTVINVDGIEWERAKWGRAAKFIFKTGAKLTAKFGDQLVCDSAEIVRRWQDEFNRDGEFIPYGGEDIEPLAPPTELAGRKYVLAVARFVPENTIPEFIEAAKTLARDWDVVIVGSSGYPGPLDVAVGGLARDTSRVHWMGHISDDKLLFSLWQNASVYFHGHSVGGTNPALVQAMACGAPTVARDTVYNREVLGDAGLFTDPNPTSIVQAIDALIRDDARQDALRRMARQRAREHYTWKLVCEKYELQLQQMLSGDTDLSVETV